MSGYEAVVVREGAAVRTADELLLVFVEDAIALGAELSPWGRITLAEFRKVMRGYTNLLSGSASLPESAEGLRMDVESLVNQLESELGTLGFDVDWNDGYVISPACICGDDPAVAPYVNWDSDCPVHRDGVELCAHEVTHTNDNGRFCSRCGAPVDSEDGAK